MPLVLFLLVFLPITAHAKTNPFIEPQQIEKLKEDSVISLKLEKVVDGDTIRTPSRKIRLWGIDAPEKDEPLYDISRLALETFIGKEPVVCKFVEKDKYQRDVMQCLVDGVDLGVLMVKSGFARDYTKYSRGFYKAEEKFAQEGKLGIWKDQN